MRLPEIALAAVAVFGAPLATAQTRPAITPAPVILPDPSSTAQQIYQQNEAVRQDTLRENALGQQRINDLYQQNKALRDQQSAHAQQPYHFEPAH